MVSSIFTCTKRNTRIIEYEIIMIFLLGPLFQKIYRDLNESNNPFDIIKDDRRYGKYLAPRFAAFKHSVTEELNLNKDIFI